MSRFYEEGFDPDDLSVKVSEMLVATADSSDELVDGAVSEVLSLLRQRMAMDVVFVSEFVDGRRVFRYVDEDESTSHIPVGASDPLEQTWCQRVVDGRMPEAIPDVANYAGKDSLPKTHHDIRTYLSTPIRLSDGQVYGTLCCFSFGPREIVEKRDLKNLKSVAQLVARKIETRQSAPQFAPTEAQPLKLVPKY
jgi:GAF domain-containing protein